MRALLLNCTLKPSPAESNTDALGRVVMDALAQDGIETDAVRVVDHDVRPGGGGEPGRGGEGAFVAAGRRPELQP